jgi:hypothetical protein
VIFSGFPPRARQGLRVTVSRPAFSIGSTTYDAQAVSPTLEAPPAGTTPSPGQGGVTPTTTASTATDGP